MRKGPIGVALGVAAAALAGCAGPLPLADACPSTLTPAIANSCSVTPGVLWRGGKPDARGASALLDLGVGSVVNLELLHDDLPAFAMAQAAPGRALGVDYFRVREWEPNVLVSPASLDASVAEFIAIVRTQAKPVYVHCRSGQNRTGVMVAAYRILEENAPPERAIEEMRRYNGAWLEQDARYLRRLQGERRAGIERMIAARMPRVLSQARLACTSAGCKEM
jgi:hypothetical protein